MRRRSFLFRAAISFLALAGVSLPAVAEDNDALQGQIGALIGAHNAALPISFVPDPFVGTAASAVVFGVNIGLKKTKAVFVVPQGRKVFPNSGDKCAYEFSLPQSEFKYANVLGFATISSLPDLRGLPSDWGGLNNLQRGAPQVVHANSEVLVSVERRPFIKRSGKPQNVRLPQGAHTLTWRAETLIDPVFDVIVPGAFLGYNAVKYARIWAKQGASAARIAAENASTAVAVAKFLVPLGIDRITDTEEVSVTHERAQNFTVWDILDPVITAKPKRMRFEASDFGGSLLSRRIGVMRKAIEAADKCQRPYGLTHDAPFLLPLGETKVKWTVSDRGPTPNGGVNSASVTQTITVEDTQAPIMVPPPSRVLEVSSKGLAAGKVKLGVPMVVDLADPMPRVERKAPKFYPVNSRTPVVWSATDASGQKSRATQWITVKKKGTNRRPAVSNKSAKTLTSKPIDIVLKGSDPDFLDARFDPLTFTIDRRPENGEFVAPLFPFFIEDYRTNPAGPFGEEFRLSNNRSQWIYRNYCSSGAPNRSQDLPVNFIYRPRFLQVTDDGIHFVIDSYWFCNPSDAGTRLRISKWNRDGDYLGQIDYSGSNDAFVIDRDGFIYTSRKVGAGSSTTLNISKIRSDFDRVPGSGFVGSWKFDFASAPFIIPQSLSYARVDSQRGLLYLNDQRRVYVFDIRGGNNRPDYLGTVNNGEPIIGVAGCNYGSSWTGFAMDIDSRGNLYVADTCSGRIHKVAASGFDRDGNFTLGEYVGWLGRCEGSTNKACDADRQISRGYSCRDDTCTVNSRERIGDRQGQLSTPVYLALDPNDVLYVAEFGNSRIQRFAPDGTFAGEAKSTGTGINQGDSPSFVLGNMGKPKAVSVNSTQFFVVDVDEAFVHVFETSPFKNVKSDSVTVTYVSKFDFQGVDRFAFSAGDGLANSKPGLVKVKVTRNFRPPKDLQMTCYRNLNRTAPIPCEVDEDGEIFVELRADDPDGIVGVDFLGLDVLKFSPAKPRNGALAARVTDTASALYSYRPKPDFNGQERIAFRVSDGRDRVGPRSFAMTVRPTNDPPRPEFVSTAAVARGFPTQFAAKYTDIDADPSEPEPGLQIAWGDGTLESRGEIVEVGADEYRATGPLLTSAAPGTGYINGTHTYTTKGGKRIEICVTDPLDASRHCTQQSVQVIDATNVTVAINAPAQNPPRADETVVYQIEVTNQVPESWPGLVANGVELIVSIPPGLIVRDAPRDCKKVAGGAELRCSIGRLVVGASVRFALVLGADSSTPLKPSKVLVAAVELKSKDISADGAASSAIEFQWPDADGDELPDAWEKANALNWLSADAEDDADGDGASNLAEYLQGSDPNDSKSTPIRPYRVDGVGVFDAKKATFLLRRQPAKGRPNLTFKYGKTNLQPLVGNWNGRDGDSVGLYDSTGGVFHLSLKNGKGSAAKIVRFGKKGLRAIAGDWNGDGRTTVGVYDPKRRAFDLDDRGAAGEQRLAFRFGARRGLLPVVGDWNGDSRDTVGLFDAKTGRFELKNTNSSGDPDLSFVLVGAAGKMPVVGDWNGDGADEVGVYDSEKGAFSLRSSTTQGRADIVFNFGGRGKVPLMGGDWNGLR